MIEARAIMKKTSVILLCVLLHSIVYSQPYDFDAPASDDSSPSWSPDGARIVFHSGRTGDREIYVMDANGDNVQRLTFSDGRDISPQWTPNGSRILFRSERTGVMHLYDMRPDGSDVRQLTDGEQRVFDVKISPDSRLIGMRRTSPFPNPTDSLWVMAIDGSNLREITANHTHVTNNSRQIRWAWSPDSQSIAYTYFVNYQAADIQSTSVLCANDGNLYEVDVATENLRSVVNVGGSGYFAQLNWLPSGELLFFKRVDESCVSPVQEGWYRLEFGQESVSTVDHLRRESAHYPTPDGRGLVFFASLEPRSPESGFFLTSLDGNEPKLLLASGWYENGGVSWAPDGVRFVTSVCADRDADIVIVDTQTGTSTNLTSGTTPGENGSRTFCGIPG